MNVGLISKEAHGKASAAALRRAGYTVTMLGGSGGIRIPPRVDVVVCRVISISHGAFDVATAARRQGKTVVFADGANDIVEKVNAVVSASESANNPDQEIINMPRGKNQLGSRLDTIIDSLSNLFGVYGPLLHSPVNRVAVQLLANRTADPAAAMATWQRTCQPDISYVKEVMDKVKAKKGWGLMDAYTFTGRGAPRQVSFVVKRMDALSSEVLEALDLCSTLDEANRRVAEAKKAAALKAATPVPAVAPVVAPVVVPAPVAPKTIPVWVMAPVADPAVAPVADPAVAPVAAPTTGGSWDTDLRHALGLFRKELLAACGIRNTMTISTEGKTTWEPLELLQEEMRSSGVQVLTLDTDGNVTDCVRVVRQTLTMTLTTEE